MFPMMRGPYMPGMYGVVPFASAHHFDVNLRKQGEGKVSNEDKVEVKNIFQSEGGGGRGDGVGGLGAMAAIAALGNRNDSRSNMGGWGGDGFGFGGGGGLGALLAVALLGGRGFGDHGHGHGRGRGDDCCEGIGQQIILSKLGSIEGAIPLAASQVQTALCEQTGTLQGGLAALALGTQQGFANLKDSVQIASSAELVAIAGAKDAIQNGLFLTNTNLLEGICAVKQNDNANADRILSALNARWSLEDQSRINAQAAEIIELRNDRDNRSRHSDLELKITNTNTAIAAQAQGQQQQQQQALFETVRGLVPLVHGLVGEFQIARATNSNLIVGSTGVATGAQTANPTNVRA